MWGVHVFIFLGFKWHQLLSFSFQAKLTTLMKKNLPILHIYLLGVELHPALGYLRFILLIIYLPPTLFFSPLSTAVFSPHPNMAWVLIHESKLSLLQPLSGQLFPPPPGSTLLRDLRSWPQQWGVAESWKSGASYSSLLMRLTVLSN